jgi:CubicO group peptidase (beta-lactamase class C family)
MISLNSLRWLVMVAALTSTTVRAADPQSLEQALEPYLKGFGLPALAASVFKDGVVIACGVAGTRRAGHDIPVEIDDPFHLGSDNKAFTSLLAGTFVQEGKLRWDSPLGEIFPELTNIPGTAADEALRKLAVSLYKEFSGKSGPSGASVWPLKQGRKNTALSKG